MTTPPADPMVGRTVAHYEVLARLGGGGMGVVYKARDVRLGRFVALKFLPPQWSHDEDAKQRFIREAQAASATDHRNICTIHDVATADDGQLFIVMAYYEGQTLKQRLEAGAIPVDEALDIATQIADGLTRAHEQGVVHRDVKPGNLILAEDGVRILDFGLATFAEAAQLTVTGSTLGTAAYMSPEQVRAEATDARTDVWAVGVILYQMLTGHVPFRGAYAEAIAHAIRNETPAPIRAEHPEVPEEIEFLVFRALHKDTSIRFANGRELARALRQVRGMTLPLDLRTGPVAVPSPARSPYVPRFRRRLAGAAAAIVVAVVAVGGWVLWPAERAPIIVMPVVNLTGVPDLEGYRRAFSLAVIQELTTSDSVRPMSWPRMLQTLRGVSAAGDDISSRSVAQALGRVGGYRYVVFPSIVRENKSWYARIEVVDASTMVSVTDGVRESAAVPDSALHKETAYRLVVGVSSLIDDHFARIPRWLRQSSTRTEIVPLDAMKMLEQGIDWYDEQEYPAAYGAFTQAATLAPRDALAVAWASRAARVMRHDDDARTAAGRALALLEPGVPTVHRRWIEAVAAEAAGDLDTAAGAYAELVDAFPDDPTWTLEHAAFEDRRAEARAGWEAVVRQYSDVLAADPGMVRPHLELCRLYNRLQDPGKAEEHGLKALQTAEDAGWRGAAALSRFCLADKFRLGDAASRQQALGHARTALAELEELNFTYNVPRGVYYVGLALAEQRQWQEATARWEIAASAASAAGNVALETVVLGNLGVAYERLGDGARADEIFRRSAAAYERLGDQRRAARQQINAAAMRIKFGESTLDAVDDVRRILDVVRARGDREFEVVALDILGDFHRMTGGYDEARQALDIALSVARTHNLPQKIVSVNLSRARLLADAGDYAAARDLLHEILRSSSGVTIDARLALARLHTRFGEPGEAATLLAEVAGALDKSDRVSTAFLALVTGELAYESGQMEAARRHFLQAASSWSDRYTYGSAVEGRAYLGLVEALLGRRAVGRAAIEGSLARAVVMQRTTLAATFRILLARVHLLDDRPAEALRVLDVIPADVRDRLAADQRAQFHFVRSRAIGAGPESVSELERARKLLNGLRLTLPEPMAKALMNRLDVRMITE